MIILTENSNIRRIDELGRIVIPKDIRKKLHIKDNEPLEIFIENNEIKIKKYSSLLDALDYINYLVDMGERITGNKYIVTDRDQIVAIKNNTLLNISLNEQLEKLVETCKEEKNKPIDFQIDDTHIKGYANIYPIIIDNDRSGMIIEYNENNTINSLEVIKIFANLIAEKLNNY